MANTINSTPISSEYHTLAEEIYSLDDKSALQDPYGKSSESPAFLYGTAIQGYPDIYHADLLGQYLLSTIGDNWYNHIHVVPSTIVLGNLLSAQEVEIEVWNGFLSRKRLMI